MVYTYKVRIQLLVGFRIRRFALQAWTLSSIRELTLISKFYPTWVSISDIKRALFQNWRTRGGVRLIENSCTLRVVYQRLNTDNCAKVPRMPRSTSRNMSIFEENRSGENWSLNRIDIITLYVERLKINKSLRFSLLDSCGFVHKKTDGDPSEKLYK